MLKLQQLALISTAIISIGSTANAASFALTEGNSTFVVDPMSQTGASQWSIGGNNQLNQQFFWYRTSSGPQYSIENGATTITPTYNGADKLSVKYNYGGIFSIDVHYNLNSLGGNSAQMEQSVGITNLTGGALSINFYQYNDFNLAGTAGSDEVWIENSAALQQEGTLAITESGIDPLAMYFEGNTTGGTSSTLYKLNNSANLNLDNTGYASGDATWAFQWQFNLSGINSGVEILKGQNLAITLIPEPTTLSLALLGLAVAGYRKKQHRSKL
ncbi:MAG: PEP-CTERM sorting domain-containing protein [Verrucomicrobiota bacterium]